MSKTTDPNGNVISVGYDLLGRKTLLTDPDLGTVVYRVDPVGQVWQQNASATGMATQTTGFVYDALGRMVTRSEGNLTSLWVYDQRAGGRCIDTHSCGQLVEAYTVAGTSKDYDRVHTYDVLGRPSTTVQTINEGAANTNYLSMVEYDAWNRSIRQTYRRGADQAKVFDSRYNDAGELVRLERGALVLWRLAAQDAAQRPTGVTFGNHLTQTRTFDVNTGRLHDSALSTGGTALPLLTESYTYDLLGNVMSRGQHWNTGGFDEVFTYDDLNRLRTSDVSGPGIQSFTYDNAGNLTSKTGVGNPGATYIYPPSNGVHPHAVQSIAGVGAFTYDGFGNMLTGAGRVYTWNSFNMPLTITKAGGSAAASSAFTYGPEHQRTRQTRGDGSVVAYAGAQEIETSSTSGATIKTYWPYGVGLEIDAPGKPAALSWVHKDRLGSPVLITDELGGVREKLAYDAWGQRRKTDGSNTTPDDVDGVTDNKGYTGHEMLDQLDLVHMNGRVYDPFTARFVSADPFVQDPSNGQSYNRYSYVLNNPTNLTDPTGFLEQVVINGAEELARLREAERHLQQLYNNLRDAQRLDARANASAKNAGKIAFRTATRTIAVGITLFFIPGNDAQDGCHGGDLCAIDPLTGEMTHAAWAQKLIDNALAEAQADQGKDAGEAVSSSTGSDAAATKKKGPKANDGDAKDHGDKKHNDAIDARIDELKTNASVRNIRKNQQQVDKDGNKVGTNRPDVQFDLDGTHHNVEYDNVPGNSRMHAETIRKHDPASVVELHLLK